MSFTCYKCAEDLVPAESIPILGSSDDDKVAKLLTSAGAHMAARHPEIMQDIVKASAGIGYLILVSNVRTDDQAIEARTKITLEATVQTVACAVNNLEGKAPLARMFLSPLQEQH